MAEQLFDFGPLRRARFVERPNRFLVRAKLRNGRVVKAFLPNPGRLWELLLPDAALYVARDAGPGSATERKTSHTVVAVERDGEPVFLHTHRTNAVARHLIEAGRIPGLEGARVVRSEVPVGRSRFDLLLDHGGEPVYTEVKSVTLFGNGVAMFPDAVTERGRKHLLELAELSRSGLRTLVLFIVHTPRVRWFMPDYHTDLAFSRALLVVRDAVGVLPVSVGWTQELELCRDVKLLEIPWGFLRREVSDRGSYLLLVHLPRRRRLEVGCLGRLGFPKGWYVYVGSAMQGLTKRIERHVRRRKRVHWHMDYLREAADRVIPLPIRSSARQECQVAEALAELLAPGPPGFGCSDCACPTHLFHSQADPLHSSAFHKVLAAFRMGGWNGP
jgi:sugar fermentation stimulation protein A